MTTRTRASFAGSVRAQQRLTSSESGPPRLFRLDGGYIVLAGAAMARGADAYAAVAAAWRDCHVTAITATPEGASEWMLADLARAAHAFDRIVICQSSEAGKVHGADSAARFARAVRAAGRTECQIAADAHRALRHCIDCMTPGEVIAYCCDDGESAARILAEHGALPVADAGNWHTRCSGRHDREAHVAIRIETNRKDEKDLAVS